MALAKLFKSRAQVMGHVFKNGKSVHFMNHNYFTTDKAEIEELTAEAESGHPNIYIDPEMTEIDPQMLDPMAVLRAKIAEEERAKILAAMNPQNDMGTSDAGGKLQGISNSESIRGLQVSSDTQAAALSQANQPVETTVAPAIGAVKVGSINPKK